jgi:hypothetical protein
MQRKGMEASPQTNVDAPAAWAASPTSTTKRDSLLAAALETAGRMIDLSGVTIPASGPTSKRAGMVRLGLLACQVVYGRTGSLVPMAATREESGKNAGPFFALQWMKPKESTVMGSFRQSAASILLLALNEQSVA